MDETPLVVLIALGGLYVAWRQVEVERHRLRHDLFERRMRVFSGCRKCSRHANGTANLPDDQLESFEQAIDGYQFLFGRDLVNLIERLWLAAIQLNSSSKGVAAYDGAGLLTSEMDEGRATCLESKNEALSVFLEAGPRLSERFQTEMELNS